MALVGPADFFITMIRNSEFLQLKDESVFRRCINYTRIDLNWLKKSRNSANQ